MTVQMVTEIVQRSYRLNYRRQNSLRFLPAQVEDCDAVITLFGALHAYNASLDPHFALSDGWETILREQFRSTYDDPDMLWILVKAQYLLDKNRQRQRQDNDDVSKRLRRLR